MKTEKDCHPQYKHSCKTWNGFKITERADFVEDGEDSYWLPGMAIFELDDYDEPIDFTHIFDYTGED